MAGISEFFDKDDLKEIDSDLDKALQRGSGPNSVAERRNVTVGTKITDEYEHMIEEIVDSSKTPFRTKSDVLLFAIEAVVPRLMSKMKDKSTLSSTILKRLKMASDHLAEEEERRQIREHLSRLGTLLSQYVVEEDLDQAVDILNKNLEIILGESDLKWKRKYARIFMSQVWPQVKMLDKHPRMKYEIDKVRELTGDK